MARNTMLIRTHNETTLWYIANANDKKMVGLNIIRHIVTNITCLDHGVHATFMEEGIVYPFDRIHIDNGKIHL